MYLCTNGHVKMPRPHDLMLLRSHTSGFANRRVELDDLVVYQSRRIQRTDYL